MNYNTQKTLSCRLLTASFLLLGSHAISYAEMVQFTPSKDNTLFNDATGSVSNGTGTLFAGRTGGRGPGAQRAVLAFDLAAVIPSGSTITEVALTLTALQAGDGSGFDDYSLHKLEKDWGEGTSFSTGGTGDASTTGDATWIHTFFDTVTWDNPGGDFVSTPSATKTLSSPATETWTSTAELVADAQSWLDDPATNFGWILIGDESVSTSARQFGSRESTASAPVLSITYTAVPEPATFSLAMLALLSGSFRLVRRS